MWGGGAAGRVCGGAAGAAGGVRGGASVLPPPTWPGRIYQKLACYETLHMQRQLITAPSRQPRVECRRRGFYQPSMYSKDRRPDELAGWPWFAVDELPGTSRGACCELNSRPYGGVVRGG